MTAAPKPIRIKSDALTRSAKGQPCTVRSAVCNGDPETTVLAHLRGVWALGVATKPGDHFAVYACAACHDALDGRSRGYVEYRDRLRALYETQANMIRDGLLIVKGAA